MLGVGPVEGASVGGVASPVGFADPLGDSDSDSDASEGSESDARSEGSSLPSLQTVSDSSDDDDADMYDEDSDGEDWDDEPEAHPASDGGWNDREARELVDDLRRGLEDMGPAAFFGEEGEDWDYESEDYLDEDLASQGGEVSAGLTTGSPSCVAAC